MRKRGKSRLQEAVEKTQSSLEFRERMEEVLQELKRGLPPVTDVEVLFSRMNF